MPDCAELQRRHQVSKIERDAAATLLLLNLAARSPSPVVSSQCEDPPAPPENAVELPADAPPAESGRQRRRKKRRARNKMIAAAAADEEKSLAFFLVKR
uniref:Uncharacterized protein n=1 Tax=Tanacetum cinerariifolium TaxID=118510 RepID=A0A699JF52_TANCI|nr:hypothetical protein [Tanacetum cinerariifolium]